MYQQTESHTENYQPNGIQTHHDVTDNNNNVSLKGFKNHYQ